MARKRTTKKQVKSSKATTVKSENREAKKISLFPKIYRFITESWKLIVTSFVSGLLLIAIALQSVSLYQNLQEEKKLSSDRQKTVAELAFWKQTVGKYKNYRDAYFKIATLEYRLGDVDEAKIYLKKILDLDPNFGKAREMEKILGT